MVISISVIMSIYCENIEWLHKSIGSILNQSFHDFEFIIVNDNPSRIENNQLLNYYKLKDNRIIIINNDKNLGLTKSLNIALKQAKGKYIARMDADDISYPSRFQKQFSFMESHPECIVCGTQIKLIPKKKSLFPSSWIKIENSSIRMQLLFGSSFAHPTVFIRYSILKENQISYDEEYAVSQDYRLWEQLWEYGEYHNLNSKLLFYRLSLSQISSQKNEIQNEYANIVKQRLRKKWLEGLGYNGINIDKVNEINQISNFKKSIRNLLRNKQDYKIYRRLLIELYYSLNPGKNNIIYSLYSGDIFFFSLRKALIFLTNSLKPD